MGKIFYIMGKSCSGKDTIYRRLLKDGAGDAPLFTAVPYTTRPMRDGESNGRDYFFTDEAGLGRRREQGRVIEERKYMTWYGPWYYFTADDGQIDLKDKNYLMIGTLVSFWLCGIISAREGASDLYRSGRRRASAEGAEPGAGTGRAEV